MDRRRFLQGSGLLALTSGCRNLKALTAALAEAAPASLPNPSGIPPRSASMAGQRASHHGIHFLPDRLLGLRHK